MLARGNDGRIANVPAQFTGLDAAVIERQQSLKEGRILAEDLLRHLHNDLPDLRQKSSQVGSDLGNGAGGT